MQKSQAKGSFKMTTLATSSHIGHGAGPVSLDNILELGRYFIQSLIPRKTLKATPNPFERKLQPFWVILKVRDACALPANIPLRTGIILVTSDLHDLTAFCDYLQAAVLATQYTRSFLPFAHTSSVSQDLFICRVHRGLPHSAPWRYGPNHHIALQHQSNLPF